MEGGGEDNAEEVGKCGAQAGRCLGLGDEWKMQLERTEGLAPFPFDLLPGPLLPLTHEAKFRLVTRGVKSRVVSRVQCGGTRCYDFKQKANAAQFCAALTQGVTM